MKQFDNYELTTIDYALKYYLEHNEMLEDDDIAVSYTHLTLPTI